jgi:DNA invertase Pin-like site-specific DNA recombinase
VTEPIDDSPAGRFMEGIRVAMSQFDNERRAERTRVGLRASVQMGRWVFKRPLGYLNSPRGKSGPSLAPETERARMDFLQASRRTLQRRLSAARHTGTIRPRAAETEWKSDDRHRQAQGSAGFPVETLRALRMIRQACDRRLGTRSLGKPIRLLLLPPEVFWCHHAQGDA